MRIPTLALIALTTATGCATTGMSAAQRRAAEIERYRQQKAQEEANKNAPEAQQPPPAQASPATKSASDAETATPAAPAPASAPSANTPSATPAPAAPALPVGPREGLFGLRASLLGNSLALGSSAGTSSSVGFRYFFTDMVGVNVDAGIAYASAGDTSVTGLSLGLGLNIYAGLSGKALRPYFALQGTLGYASAGTQSATATGIAAGGGLEYWLTPQLSVNTTLLFGVATVSNTKGVALGTFQPGLGVTLFTE